MSMLVRRADVDAALQDFDPRWSVDDAGWGRVEIDTDREGVILCVWTPVAGCEPGASGEGSIRAAVIEEETGLPIVDAEGRAFAPPPIQGDGWQAMLTAVAEELIDRAERAQECPTCGGLLVRDGATARCSTCPYSPERECPACKGVMSLRYRKLDGAPFWGCNDTSCARGLRVDGEQGPPPEPEPSDLQDPAQGEGGKRYREARRILQDPLVASPAATKLLDLLEREPERVYPLVLGDLTPGGKPTVQAVLERKRANGEKPKPRKTVGKPKVNRRAKAWGEKPGQVIDPSVLEGIELYAPGDRPQGEAVEVVEVPERGGSTVAALAFQHHELPHERLNPVQTAVLPYVEQDVNLVVAAATSAGKTVIAEMMMADALARGAKAIFLSPLRAVSQEKHDDWTDSDHPWSQRQVSIVTGDYVLSDARKKELRRAEVIVMTSEMLDSKTRRMHQEQNTWLLQTLCLVVDEAHLLTMKGRGDALECGLMRFSKQNPHARIVLLSATMPNVDELGAWLTKLNGKPSRVIRSAWRPTKLTVHWPTYYARTGTGSYQQNETSKRKRAIELLQQHPDDKWIVFVHSKKAGRELHAELLRERESVEFHNADLDRDSRLGLERRFRYEDLRIVIATSTLAWGINMPARRVLILGVHRGIQEVDPIDVKQMIGRAGRTGLDPEGDAYIMLPLESGNPAKTEGMRRRYMEIGRIVSQINDIDTLAFHLTAEVAEGQVRTQAEAVEWHARSLSAFQGQGLREDGHLMSAAQVMERLEKAGILKREGFAYEATMLGRVSSWLYFSPFDISNWCSNFRKLVETDRLRDDDALAWALGAVHSAFRESYMPREHENDHYDLMARLRQKGIDKVSLPATVLAYRGLLKGVEYQGLISQQRALLHDIDRVMQALSMIDRYVLKGMPASYPALLASRVRHGCSWQEADLCRLPGIGGKRARSLVDHGVTSVRDVLQNKGAVIAALGNRVAIGAIRGAKDLLRKK